MKVLLDLLGYLLKGIIFGILPFLVFTMITSKTSMIMGIRSFVILTGSMNPAIPAGSIVYTQSFPDYHPNDIISFKSSNVTVTHRIIDVVKKDGQTFYKTQGDANNTSDDKFVSKKDVLGKVFYHIPYFGRFTAYLKTLHGFLIFIVLPALIYIIFEIINIKNEMAKEIEKKLKKQMNLI